MPPAPRRRVVTARLLRPADLLDLHLSAVGGELHRTNRGPVLSVGDEAGHLVVRLSFQHLGEQAWFESQASPDPSGVATHRAARASRLVYELPAGTELLWTGESLLRELPRLRLRVVPLATPGPDSYPEDESPGTGPSDFVLPPWVLEPIELGAITGRRTVAGAAVEVGRTRLLRGMSRGAVGRLGDLPNLVLRPPGDVIARPPGRVIGRPPGGGVVRPPRPPRPPRVKPPRAPEGDETAIEVPYRLIVSPSAEHGAFLFDPEPVGPETDPGRVQLWYARFTTRVEDKEQQFVGHDDGSVQRVVRAVWTRDLEPPDLGSSDDVTRMSTAPPDRRALVRQSAARHEGITPIPFRVRRLDLSALGASVDWRGAWDTRPYADSTGWNGGDTQLVGSYRHLAATGRDSYVRLSYPGFLFPFGHRAELVVITERKIHEPTRTAYLRQRNFIVLRERTRAWSERDTPLGLVTLEPPVTPDLEEVDKDLPSFPRRGTDPFRWDLIGVDRGGETVTLSAPLLFVPDKAIVDQREAGQTPAQIQQSLSADYQLHRRVAAHGQPVAFAAPLDHGDTELETTYLDWDGHLDAENYTSRPYLVSATAVVPSLRHLAGQAPAVKLEYADPYLAPDPAGEQALGFGPANPGGLFLRLAAAPVSVDFSTGTDKAGGFVSPNLTVKALSRSLGAVGDDGSAGTGLASGRFDPAVFLEGALPKLFGLFSLVDLLEALGIDLDLDDAPEFVTDALDTVSAILAEVQRLRAAVDTALDRLDEDIARAAHDGARQAVEAAKQELEDAFQQATGTLQDQLDAVTTALSGLLGNPGGIGDAQDAVQGLTAFLQPLRDALAHPRLPVAARSALAKPLEALDALLSAAEVLKAVADFAEGLLRPADGVTARYEWTPRIGSWGFPGQDPVFVVNDEHGFSLAVEVRASAQGSASADVSAELRDFALQLLPGESLLAMNFSRIGFRVGSGTKPEVDVVFDGMEFLGALGFIETLRRMIPFDGFADPPYVDVAPDGVTAGFDLELPNVSVGVFSLENIALGADARVPFLGDAVTVGFAFCSKDSPFRLTVMCIGGGGWVALRLSPMGLVELEMGLEAAAALSIDLGVASGSVSISVGVYLRLEADAGSLTGYFRIRGEVDVLGLISASITLELSLTYDFPTGKMIGRASVVVEIEILFFSASVEVSCERRLAGSKGDPVLADIMPPDASGHSDAWSAYCAAFAPGA